MELLGCWAHQNLGPLENWVHSYCTQQKELGWIWIKSLLTFSVWIMWTLGVNFVDLAKQERTFDRVSLGWSKKNFFEKKMKMVDSKNWDYQNWQFSIFFYEKGYLSNLLVRWLLPRFFVFWDNDFKFWLQLFFWAL